MKVIDNFLSDYYFKRIEDDVLSSTFPWFFNDHIHHRGDGQYQYTHNFYRYVDKEPSQWYPLIHDCLRELRPQKLERIKANLNPQTLSHSRGGYHIDVADVTTSIFYINTNNGWTEFQNGDKVECVENRMVIFDSNLEHEGVSCTDQLRKVVINFNYER